MIIEEKVEREYRRKDKIIWEREEQLEDREKNRMKEEETIEEQGMEDLEKKTPFDCF